MLTSDPRFRPPFCPWPKCRFHRDERGFSWVFRGTYQRKAKPHEIRRFQCRGCRRGFSTQTFDTTYYLKRPDIQQPLFHMLVACTAFRQGGRSLSVEGSTLERQASRLGRHCLLFQQMKAPLTERTEPLVLDGFVTVEYSQYWPFELNLLVGADSHFVYGFTESELRRSGGMTPFQKQRRDVLEARYGRPAPDATVRAVRQLLDLAIPADSHVTIRSDEHAAYPRAFRQSRRRINHRTVSSRRCRTRQNPLFAVDLADLLLRHSGANHTRETIAFSKRRQGALERAAVFQVWRNFMKRTSERDRQSPTPGEHLGLASKRLDVPAVLYRRLFVTRIGLPDPLLSYYRRDVPTRQIPNGTTHRLKRAF